MTRYTNDEEQARLSTVASDTAGPTVTCVFHESSFTSKETTPLDLHHDGEDVECS